MDAVIRRHLLRKILDIEADHLCDCRLAATSELLHIRNDYGVKNPTGAILGQTENTNLFDKRRLLVMRLQFFRINVLAVCKDDDVLASSGDRKIAVAVNEAEITGAKPAFFDRLSRLFRRSIIALHHDQSTNQHFSYALVTWILDTDGHTAKGFPNRAEPVIFRRCDGRCG